jgi:hypothetical protein
MTDTTVWKELDVDNWPEKCRIYCSKCGGKNRSDLGWRYSDTESTRHLVEEKTRASFASCPGLDIFSLMDREFARNLYECDQCRTDKK